MGRYKISFAWTSLMNKQFSICRASSTSVCPRQSRHLWNRCTSLLRYIFLIRLFVIVFINTRFCSWKHYDVCVGIDYTCICDVLIMLVICDVCDVMIILVICDVYDVMIILVISLTLIQIYVEK